MSRLSGAAGEQAIETAKFTFADDHAVLHFTQGGTQKQLIIGTDGTRRQNILPLQSSPTSRVELAVGGSRKIRSPWQRAGWKPALK